MEGAKELNYKNELMEDLICQKAKNDENNLLIARKNKDINKRNYYDNLYIPNNLDDKIKFKKEELFDKEIHSKKNIKNNHKTFDLNKESIFMFEGIDESLDLGKIEEENNFQNNFKMYSKDKSDADTDRNKVSFKAESFRQNLFEGNYGEITGFEKSKYYSDRLFMNSKEYFHNIQELISNKMNNKKEENFMSKIKGDTNEVLPFWIDMDLRVENEIYKNGKINIQKNNAEKPRGTVKCLTYREEASKTLENFEENLQNENKNNALSECNEDENFIEKFNKNEYEMNGNDKVPVKMLKVSNYEGYYEFNNNLNFNSDKAINDKQPKVYNEYIKNEINHQVNLNPLNQSNLNNPRNSTPNSIIEDDHVISKENLSSKGFFRIDTNNASVIKLPENYWTNDIDKKTLVDLINENPTAKWEKIKVDANIENNPSILIKTIAIINGFNMEEIFNAIANVNIRKIWDTLFSEFKIVEENKEEKSEVLYMSLKSPFPMIQRRDFVQQRKIWHDFPDKNSVCIHFKSIDHPLCPLYKKITRAHTYISGYFIKTESLNPLKCTVHIISQTDVNGKIPKWIVNKVSETAPNDWVKNLIKGCNMVREKKLISG